MEKELNIAAILKGKPEHTKLWSDTFGSVFLTECMEDSFNVQCRDDNLVWSYLPNGTFRKYMGIMSIFPSKSMRSWEKFAWKKGDVLQYNDDDMGVFLVFDRWKDDTYEHFIGKFEINHPSMCDEITSSREMSEGITNECHLIGEGPLKEEYLADVEKAFGGKLNLDTLEIEKPQFKDGDILVVNERNRMPKGIFIFDEKSQPADLSTQISISAYAFYDAGNSIVTINDGVYVDGRKLRLATDSEKQQLFDALAKENKAWDAEKKAIVDLPKKCEFKALDYILVRDKGHVLPMWQLYQYAHENENYIYVVGSLYGLDRERIEFIPYNDKTAHLLGTTDDWKGGEE